MGDFNNIDTLNKPSNVEDLETQEIDNLLMESTGVLKTSQDHEEQNKLEDKTYRPKRIRLALVLSAVLVLGLCAPNSSKEIRKNKEGFNKLINNNPDLNDGDIVEIVVNDKKSSYLEQVDENPNVSDIDKNEPENINSDITPNPTDIPTEDNSIDEEDKDNKKGGEPPKKNENADDTDEKDKEQQPTIAPTPAQDNAAVIIPTDAPEPISDVAHTEDTTATPNTMADKEPTPTSASIETTPIPTITQTPDDVFEPTLTHIPDYANEEIIFNPPHTIKKEYVGRVLEPTDEMIKKLQSYPYFEDTPKEDFNKIITQHKNRAEWIYYIFINVCVDLSDNEKIYTNEHLTYFSWNNHYVIRFELHTTLDDGTIEKKHMEYEFSLSGWERFELRSSGFRELSDIKQ